ncbi:MAG: hypothetical protein ACOYKA_00115 [Legionellaceae bacterium]
MKWTIPAKTFLVGEYIALVGGPALLLTTSPSFELGIVEEQSASQIHEDSPAGRLWKKTGLREHLSWHDPYHGLGGLGASSAQFLGAYYAQAFLKGTSIDPQEMLDAYFDCAWRGVGLRPSGYDVLAQHRQGHVYLNRSSDDYLSLNWPFLDISFVLIHTGHKLQTHHHLEALVLPLVMERLTALVYSARDAFLTAQSSLLIDAVNGYFEQLKQMNWVTPHTIGLVEHLKQDPDVLAIKGCGAMGADVLLVLVPNERLSAAREKFRGQGYLILASN